MENQHETCFEFNDELFQMAFYVGTFPNLFSTECILVLTEPKANRECSGRWVGCRCWQSHLNSGPFLPALETGPCTRATTTMTIDWSQRADCGTTWHHVHGRILQTGKRILTLLLTRSNYGPDIAMPARETSRTWLFLRPETRQKIEARWRAKECQAHSLPGMPQS